jgi:hypothetical protein
MVVGPAAGKPLLAQSATTQEQASQPTTIGFRTSDFTAARLCLPGNPSLEQPCGRGGRGTEFFGCAIVNHEGCEALPRWEIMQGNAWSAKGAIHTSLGQRPRS